MPSRCALFATFASGTIELNPEAALSDDPDHLLRHVYANERAWFSGS